MRLSHPIFQGPRRVELDTAMADTPKNYRIYPDGEGLPDRLSCWRVLEKPYPESEPGLVCASFGFEDSPECEWISGGINSKNASALALARQANLFYWGFSGAPADMTPSGRAVLVNAIAYMDQFDGEAPLIGRGAAGSRAMSREWALVQARQIEWRAGRGEDVSALQAALPARVRTAAAGDPARIRAWYRQHLEFLARPDPAWDIDPDCVRLGIGNRDRKFIPALIERVERDPRDGLALTLLGRYVPAARTLDRDELRSWHRRVEPYLYFTDKGGFEWRVDAPALAAGRPRVRSLAPPSTTRDSSR